LGSEPLQRARLPHYLSALALASGLALGACSEKVEPTPAAAKPAASANAASPAAPPAGVTVRARIHADGPETAFTLVAEAPADAGAALNVRAIEIRRNGAADVTQRIEGLSTSTPSSAESPGLDVLDLNFDGHADIRLIESQPAGPNVPYRHWLYQPATGLFVAATALDALGAPQPDAGHRELRVDWRDGATRSGSDFYVWQAGKPEAALVPVRKESRQYTKPGAYTLSVSVPEGDRWRVVSQKKMREP
jgi:hypothetical protein